MSVGDPEASAGGPMPGPAAPEKPAPRGWIPLAFALAGLLIVLAASLTTRILEIPVTAQFGLLQILPPTYWVGLGLIAFALGLSISRRSEAVTLLTGALFFAVFAVTPALFEPNPPVWDAYLHFVNAQEISRLGRLPTATTDYAADWPGFFVITWACSVVSAVAPRTILILYPPLTSAATFVSLFLFLRSAFPRGPALLGSVLGSLLNVWAQFHVSPQSLGLFLTFLVLATVWERELAVRTASAFLFLGLVVTHPTSTIYLLMFFAVDAVLRQLRWPRRRGIRVRAADERRFAHNPAVPFGVVWLGWLFFQASGSSATAKAAILLRIGSILTVPEQTARLAAARTGENLFALPPLVRLAALGLVGGIVLLALLFVTLRARSSTARFLWGIIIGLGAIAVADIVLFGGQYYDRSLMFFAAIGPTVGLATFRGRSFPRPIPHLVIAVLVVAAAGAASTAYYQESLYFVSDQSIATSVFLERTPPDSVLLDGLFPAPIWLAPQDRTPSEDVGFYVFYPRDFLDIAGSSATYAIFDPTAKLWYLQYRGVAVYEFYEHNATSFSRIYDNGRSVVVLINDPSGSG